MATLIHFVASWASAICDPHRREVATAAAELGLEVVEIDVDDDQDTARLFHVMNVPSVALGGFPESTVVGAVASKGLVKRLRPFIV